VVALVALSLATPPSLGAAPVAGKWGLGVDTGDLLDSSAEGTILRGRSERTAWLVLVALSVSDRDQRDEATYIIPDTLVVRSNASDYYSFAIGPGVRRYFHPNGRATGYFDVTGQVLRARRTSTGEASPQAYKQVNSTWGGEVGLALGFEYFFERWPVSLAAHTRVLSVRYTTSKETSSTTGPFPGPNIDRDYDEFSTSGGVGPRLQIRVYF
jgi:hypothetical protein